MFLEGPFISLLHEKKMIFMTFSTPYSVVNPFGTSPQWADILQIFGDFLFALMIQLFADLNTLSQITNI